jgi:hypothetical protein
MKFKKPFDSLVPILITLEVERPLIIFQSGCFCQTAVIVQGYYLVAVAFTWDLPGYYLLHFFCGFGMKMTILLSSLKY